MRNWRNRYNRLRDLLGVGKPTISELVIFFMTREDGVRVDVHTGEQITDERWSTARLRVNQGPLQNQDEREAALAAAMDSGVIEMQMTPDESGNACSE